MTFQVARLAQSYKAKAKVKAGSSSVGKGTGEPECWALPEGSQLTPGKSQGLSDPYTPPLHISLTHLPVLLQFPVAHTFQRNLSVHPHKVSLLRLWLWTSSWETTKISQDLGPARPPELALWFTQLSR